MMASECTFQLPNSITPGENATLTKVLASLEMFPHFKSIFADYVVLEMSYSLVHNDVIKWKHSSRYNWAFVCWEFLGHGWIPLTEANDAELSRFLWSAPEQTAVQTNEISVIWDADTLIMTSL